MGQFNPSIVPAPDGLCPRCAYVASLRVDPLHQCSRQSPLFKTPRGLTKRPMSATAWFRNTAIVILDARLEIIGWTWLIAVPHAQINPAWEYKNWTIGFGKSDGFKPPWTGQIFDVRLFNMHGRIFGTVVCAKCSFALMLITMTGDVTSDGGVTHLRAWRQTEQRFISSKPWAQGRNQALFAATATEPSSRVAWSVRGEPACGGMPTCATMYLQPWIGVVGTLGAPAFQSRRYICLSRRVSRPRGDRTRPGDRNICAHNPLLAHIKVESVSNPETTSLRVWTKRPRRERLMGRRHQPPPPPPPPPPPMPPVQANSFGRLNLLYNETGQIPELRLEGHRVSATANLVQVAYRSKTGQRCEALLGVGHVRRREGDCTDQKRVCDMWKAPDSLPPFRYGYQYTHFFYTMEPRPPFRLVGASNEFCLSSTQDQSDCESVQFISGMSLDPAEPQWRQSTHAAGADYQLEAQTLLLAFGVNDCEAKIARLSLNRVLESVQPLHAGGQVSSCS